MFFKFGKTNKFSIFHLENGDIQSVLLFSVCFHVEKPVISVKNKRFVRLVYVFYLSISFFLEKSIILSKLLAFEANKCLILFSFCKLNTF